MDYNTISVEDDIFFNPPTVWCSKSKKNVKKTSDRGKEILLERKTKKDLEETKKKIIENDRNNSYNIMVQYSQEEKYKELFEYMDNCDYKNINEYFKNPEFLMEFVKYSLEAEEKSGWAFTTPIGTQILEEIFSWMDIYKNDSCTPMIVELMSDARYKEMLEYLAEGLEEDIEDIEDIE